MTKRDRIRRTILLCCHFSRNLAYYRAGWENGEPKFSTELWATINSNFLDSCLLEWCKLFGNEKNEKQHWKKVVSNKSKFRAELIESLGIKSSEMKRYAKSILKYRNEFLAHLGSEKTMNVPVLDLAFESVVFYFEYLKKNHSQENYFTNLPSDLSVYYENSYKEAIKLSSEMTQT